MIFSPFRTRSRCQSSARSSRACVQRRSSAPNASGQKPRRLRSRIAGIAGGLFANAGAKRKALVLLERALALDPKYALAHACAAHCHHTIFLRGGLNEEHRTASIRHARSAIAHGQDDALALTLAGFSLGMDAHDRAAAFVAFDAAIAISPSTAFAYILGGASLAWIGAADRAIEWAERGLRLSPRPLAFDGLHRVGDREFPARPIRGGRGRRTQGRAMQSRLQYLPCGAGGGTGKARSDRRSQSCRGPRIGIAVGISLRSLSFRP